MMKIRRTDVWSINIEPIIGFGYNKDIINAGKSVFTIHHVTFLCFQYTKFILEVKYDNTKI